MGLVLLILVPLVELFIIIRVAGVIGGWETLLLLILIGFLGTWLVKWQGISTMVRASRAMSERRVPDKELLDGFLILMAAMLLVIPGFASDAIALFLLLPPTRGLVRGQMMKRFKAGPGGVFGVVVGSGGRFVGSFRAGSHEVTGREADGSAPGTSGPSGTFDASGRELDSEYPDPENPTSER